MHNHQKPLECQLTLVLPSSFNSVKRFWCLKIRLSKGQLRKSFYHTTFAKLFIKLYFWGNFNIYGTLQFFFVKLPNTIEPDNIDVNIVKWNINSKQGIKRSIWHKTRLILSSNCLPDFVQAPVHFVNSSYMLFVIASRKTYPKSAATIVEMCSSNTWTMKA